MAGHDGAGRQRTAPDLGGERGSEHNILLLVEAEQIRALKIIIAHAVNRSKWILQGRRELHKNPARGERGTARHAAADNRAGHRASQPKRQKSRRPPNKIRFHRLGILAYCETKSRAACDWDSSRRFTVPSGAKSLFETLRDWTCFDAEWIWHGSARVFRPDFSTGKSWRTASPCGQPTGRL